MKKHIYFVRHGETEDNVSRIRQRDESKLTEKGIEQAHIVGKRFLNIPIDTIVTSSLIRAEQTAEIINSYLNKPLDSKELFREIIKPTEVVGLHTDDPKSKEITHEILENFGVPDWHYSDEENLDDIKERMLKAIKHIEEMPEENILVVTHGHFSRIFLAVLLFGKELTAKEYMKVVYSHTTKNTGITLYEFDPEREGWEKQGWLLKTWNDHAHLGEILTK